MCVCLTFPDRRVPNDDFAIKARTSLFGSVREGPISFRTLTGSRTRKLGRPRPSPPSSSLTQKCSSPPCESVWKRWTAVSKMSPKGMPPSKMRFCKCTSSPLVPHSLLNGVVSQLAKVHNLHALLAGSNHLGHGL